MLNNHFSIASFLLLFLVSHVTLSHTNSGESSRKPADTVQNTGENECSDNNLFISEDEVSSADASSVCKEANGELVSVTNSNFNTITSLLIRCKGPGTRGWIKSWQGADYGSDCLNIYAGQAVPGGGVDANCLEDSAPAICSKKAIIEPEQEQASVNADNYHATSSIDPSASESLYLFLKTVLHPRKQRLQTL